MNICQLQKKSGAIVIISLFLMVILTTLGASFLLMSASEAKISLRLKKMTQNFYIAEAGLERAYYDLRQDFLGLANPSWADGDINGFLIGPAPTPDNDPTFYTIPYVGEPNDNTMNGGTYIAELQNVPGENKEIWIKTTGTLDGISQSILAYAKITNNSLWNNAIYAGVGQSGAVINGNVDIRGSVHILGEGLAPTDIALNFSGTGGIGNNYDGLPADILARIPNLPTVMHNGEVVESLSAFLYVKHGQVGLSGTGEVGQVDVMGNSLKETVDGVFINDGYTGNKGESNVFSDNGTQNLYEGAELDFPSLYDPYQGEPTYLAWLRLNALVIDDPADLNVLANITPNSSFSFSDIKGSISMDGEGNLDLDGIIYIDDGVLNMDKAGSMKTITYTGSAALLVTLDVNIDVDLVTPGGSVTYPMNNIGIMTPNKIFFNASSIDVMGLFYAEDKITVEKQTNIVGALVSNYFDLGNQVPSIFQVPSVADFLPFGLIGNEPNWSLGIVSWEKL